MSFVGQPRRYPLMASDESRGITVSHATIFTDSNHDPYRLVYKEPGLEFAFFMAGNYEERKHVRKGVERVGKLLTTQYIIRRTIVLNQEVYERVIGNIKEAAIAGARAYDSFNIAPDYDYRVEVIDD